MISALAIGGVDPSGGERAQVRAQLALLLEERRPDAVKTGMLATAENVRVVADVLRDAAFGASNLVVDPVLVASSGRRLTADDAIEHLIAELFPLACAVTPNVPELERLAGRVVTTLDDARAAAHALIARGARAIVVKGGHLSGDAVDLLVTADGDASFAGPRMDASLHGTGCAFASMLAARLALGADLEAAVGAAKTYVSGLLRASDRDGLRRALRLYLIADTGVVSPPRLPGIVAAAVNGGVGIVQLRAKGLETLAQVELARELAAICERAGARFVVNDRLDVALASGADGVHVGHQGIEDLAPADARRILGADAIVGVSVGSPDEAARAEAAGATYVSAGPMFPTTTKADAGPAAGEPLLRAVRAAVTIPVVAIGGITAARADDLHAAGADGVCVGAAILGAADPTAAARAFELVATGSAA